MNSIFEKIERMKKINSLIDLICKTDKSLQSPFLGIKENEKVYPSYFYSLINHTVCYYDSKANSRISFYGNSKQIRTKCSEGGNGQDLIIRFKKFIDNGKSSYLNDYKEIWGWEEKDLQTIRNFAYEIGFIKNKNYKYSFYE